MAQALMREQPGDLRKGLRPHGAEALADDRVLQDEPGGGPPDVEAGEEGAGREGFHEQLRRGLAREEGEERRQGDGQDAADAEHRRGQHGRERRQDPDEAADRIGHDGRGRTADQHGGQRRAKDREGRERPPLPDEQRCGRPGQH